MRSGYCGVLAILGGGCVAALVVYATASYSNDSGARPPILALRGPCQISLNYNNSLGAELELELIQTQMTQKPMLRAEVYARALRASQNRKEDSV